MGEHQGREKGKNKRKVAAKKNPNNLFISKYILMMTVYN